MQPLSFDNKQFRIKEESQRLLIRSLNEYVLLFVVFLIKIIVDSFVILTIVEVTGAESNRLNGKQTYVYILSN
jgi:hypothetical protein